MSRKKISVVGTDYRAHYPRLYALTDEGRGRGRARHSEIQLSRHGTGEKKGRPTTFSRRDSVKTFSPKARSPFPSLLFHSARPVLLYRTFIENSTAVKRALARPNRFSLSRRDSARLRRAAPRIETLCRFVDLQQNIRSSWQ